MIDLKIVKIAQDAKLPIKNNITDAGYDLYAHTFKKIYLYGCNNKEDIYEPNNNIEYIELKPMERVLIGTGIKLQLETDKPVQLEIRSRSGNSLKHGLCVANQPGTVN